MKYTLRPYQKKAVKVMLDDYSSPDKSVLSLPTGSGKSIVIANFVAKTDRPAIILQPSREILAVNREKLLTYVDEDEVGIYSASFDSKKIKRYTFATIQTVYKVPNLFNNFPTIIIDEADEYPNKKDSMYNKFLRRNKQAKVFGLTATPYRIVQKKKVRYPKMTIMSVLRMLDQEAFDKILFCINTAKLMEKGYLSPMKYHDMTEVKANFQLNSDKKILEDFELRLTLGRDKLMSWDKTRSKLKGSTIVFCPTINVARLLQRNTENSALITGKTKDSLRDTMFEKFQNQELQILFNVGVLTVGVDVPHLNNIVMLRPTKSLRLYNQILGRGTRLYDGKKHCNVYDLCGVIRHMGKLRDIYVKKDEDKNWNVETKKGWQRNRIQSYYTTEL